MAHYLNRLIFPTQMNLLLREYLSLGDIAEILD